MKTWFRYSSLVLALLLPLAVIKAPAQLLPWLSTHYVPQLKLDGLRGSFWQGTAEQAGWQLGEAVLPLGTLHWAVDMEMLLELRPQLVVNSLADSHHFQGRLEFVGRQLTISQLSGQFPLSLLEAWMPMLVSADVQLQLEELVYRDGQITELTATLAAEQVAWVGGDYQMPLGSYYADVVLLDGVVVMLVEDQEALLGADARLQLDQLGRYQFSATLEPREQLAPEIKKTIGWFGRRDQQGRVLVNQRGRWK
jgi:hypothetical protein